MVHSFHRAALILLPVSQNCYRYLKNAVQYFLYNLILFIYSIFFFITTRTFVRFIFHSKFIEPTINTHAISSCSINCNCDGINMFSSSEFSHIRDFSNFWFKSRFLVHQYQFYFYRDSKHNVERFSWTHNFQFIDTFSTQTSLLFSIFSWFLYTTSVIDMVT